VTRRPNCYRCCANWESVSCPAHRSGHGFLTGTIRSPEDLADDDWRKSQPAPHRGQLRKEPAHRRRDQNRRRRARCHTAHIALAWLLAQGDDIAPIPGTKHVTRVEENIAAEGIELSMEQIERLNDLTPATGERHEEGT
jgi:aryl-alcohol dehydrogenase-like predicted oxidoreductase